MKCLNCDKEVVQYEGKRARVYCNDKCRKSYKRSIPDKAITGQAVTLPAGVVRPGRGDNEWSMAVEYRDKIDSLLGLTLDELHNNGRTMHYIRRGLE